MAPIAHLNLIATETDREASTDTVGMVNAPDHDESRDAFQDATGLECRQQITTRVQAPPDAQATAVPAPTGQSGPRCSCAARLGVKSTSKSGEGLGL